MAPIDTPASDDQKSSKAAGPPLRMAETARKRSTRDDGNANAADTGALTPAEAARRIAAAYPDFIARAEKNAVVWKDGTRMTVDDGVAKTPGERLELADLHDQFFDPYVSGRAELEPVKDIDPGRARHEPFFLKMYGDCKTADFEKKLVPVQWLPNHGGGVINATPINGVAAQLQQISTELDALPKALIKYLRPVGDVFNCEPIAGTARSSMHAYGAAIDLNPRYADDWQRASRKRDTIRYRNRIPLEIVEIFERHGFIWGGKWYHHDTAHFEFRPELLTHSAVVQVRDVSRTSEAQTVQQRSPAALSGLAPPGAETLTLPMPVRQPRTIR